MPVSSAVRYDRGSPEIVIVNESRDIDEKRLARIVKALQTQVDRDFFPLWGWRAKLLLDPKPKRLRAMKIELTEIPDEDDALGYHFIDGLPSTYVFTRDLKGNPVEDFESTLSHEVLEMIADPGVNLYAQGHYRSGKRKYQAFIPLEVCDPVEGNLYEIDGVTVSDFVVPEWFEPERERGSMPFSFRKSVDEPFAIAEGGYVDAVIGKSIRTVWGPSANAKKRRRRARTRAQIGQFDRVRSP